MALLNKAARVDGLVGRPELNGRQGFVLQFDADKGRYSVRLAGEANTLALKPANLELAEAPIGLTIDKQTVPDVLLAVMQGEALVDAELASACMKQLLKFMSGKSEETAAIEGGGVELIVPLLAAHVNTPLTSDLSRTGHPLWIGLCAAANIVLSGLDTQHLGAVGALPSSAVRKQRAADAGIYGICMEILKVHKTSDLQTMALSVIGNVTSGGEFPDTESRRIAAAKAGAITATCDAMRLAPHRSSVAAFGMTSIASICAGPTSKDVAARRDEAVAHGALELTVEGMRRHEGVIGKHLMGGEHGQSAIMLPGSVLHIGALAIGFVVKPGVDEAKEAAAARVQRALKAGVVDAATIVARAHPQKHSITLDTSEFVDLSHALKEMIGGVFNALGGDKAVQELIEANIDAFEEIMAVMDNGRA